MRVEHCVMRECVKFESFNRDSQDIPEIRRRPILPGMSGEERVAVPRHALLSESRLTSAAFGRNQSMETTTDFTDSTDTEGRGNTHRHDRTKV